LNLIDDRNVGKFNDINFKNLFARKDNNFQCFLSLIKLASTYEDLVVILPNIWAINCLLLCKKIRTFAEGWQSVTTTAVEADFFYDNSIGESNFKFVHQ
jgi:hypothetical protein